VIAALNQGRQKAIARAKAAAAEHQVLVMRADLLDRSLGTGSRGRAGRITRRLRRNGIEISERHVKRILDTLVSVSDSPSHDSVPDTFRD
jgi:hypothetical protein